MDALIESSTTAAPQNSELRRRRSRERRRRAPAPSAPAAAPNVQLGYMTNSNGVRWISGDRDGHVESFFVKANAPGEGRAIWLRFTLRSPRRSPENASAEVWAVLFDQQTGPPRAWKSSGSARSATLSREQLGFEALGCELAPGFTRGSIPGPAGEIAWELRWSGRGDELRLLPTDALYESRRFPRTKLLSAEPDGRFDGWVAAGQRRLELRDWPGMQGHNWGRGHAARYAWGHANAFAGHPGTVFEGASAAVRVGRVMTPLLTIALLRHNGRSHDFRGARHWLNRSARIEPARWSFRASSDEARIDVAFETAPQDTAGLVYEDPDGERAICLNSKLARCRIHLAMRTAQGFEPAETLICEDAAALETLWRDGAHGVPVLL
jgi:tocopherol cyclase-like protein